LFRLCGLTANGSSAVWGFRIRWGLPTAIFSDLIWAFPVFPSFLIVSLFSLCFCSRVFIPMKITTLSLMALCLAATSFPLSAATWTGTIANWTGDSWGLSGDYPGSATSPDNTGLIQGTNANVTLDTQLSSQLGTVRIIGSSTLTVDTGGEMELGASTELDFRNATLNVSGGNVRVLHNVTFGRWNGATEESQLHVSSGVFDYGASPGSGRLFNLRNNSNAGTGSISVSGSGTFQASNGGLFTHANLKDVTLSLSGSATFDLVGASASSTWDMAGDTGIPGLSHTLSVSGSLVTAEAGGLNAYATDSDQQALIKFIADGSGFSTFSVGTLNLSGGAKAADLEVDVAGLGAGTYDLFSYTTLSGSAFNSVTILKGNGTIDYGTGSSDTVSITVVPEPSTLALFGMAGAAALIAFRRRW